MGTFIYPAFRLKHPHKLWPVVEDLKRQAQANVVVKLRELYWDRLIRQDVDSADFREKVKSPDDWYNRLDLIHRELKEAYAKSLTNPYRDECNFEVSFAITEHQGDFFLRPFCDFASAVGGSLQFLVEDPRLQDYHYQDKTDKPAEVSPRSWDRRRKTWDSMLDPAGSPKNQLIVEICSWHIYMYDLDPWLELYREYSKKPPKLPCKEAVVAKDLKVMRNFKKALGRPGRIEAWTHQGERALIKKRGDLWFSTLVGEKKSHPSLKEAMEHVRYHYLPPHIKEMLANYRK